jgi:hypothetical protein
VPTLNLFQCLCKPAIVHVEVWRPVVAFFYARREVATGRHFGGVAVAVAVGFGLRTVLASFYRGVVCVLLEHPSVGGAGGFHEAGADFRGEGGTGQSCEFLGGQYISLGEGRDCTSKDWAYHS